jgi:hypothetical protein
VNLVKKAPLLILSLLLLTVSLLSTNISIVKVSLAQGDHDIAVVKVAPSMISVRLGNPVNISVVVANQGTATENFTVSLYYDTTIIETKPVTSLQPALNTTLVFTWSTTSLKGEIYLTDDKEKSYTIKAIAAPMSGETETQDNELTAINPIRVLMQYISVVPQRTLDTSITPGKNYTVAVYTDYNGTDIWSWQLSLSYNPIFLEGIEVVNGDLITAAKHPNATFVAGSFNNTKGELSITAALIEYQTPPAPTIPGPGTLARVIFRVKETGESNITFIEKQTKLFGPNAVEIINYFSPSIDHLLYGSFSNTEIQAIHDIAVVSATPSPTVVTKGATVDITVVVENQGTIAENFNVVLYYDYNPPLSTPAIGQPQTVLGLVPNTQKTLSFTWNTTTVNEKSYTITAVVPQVSGETDTTDNKLQSSETVTVEAKTLRPLPITEIVIGIAIVVAIIVAIVIFRRRRKKPTPE